MEIVVSIAMLLVALAFSVKLTSHSRLGIAILSIIAALFTAMMPETAALQSKTQIADSLQQPELMLNLAVLMTLDVIFQLTFCILEVRRYSGEKFTRSIMCIYHIVRWIPGILLFPVLFVLLTQVIFTFPGVDFGTIGWICAGAVLVLFPTLSYALKYAIPRRDSRLEMIFLLNALIAMLGIVATVNGRTAAEGTNDVDLMALGAIGMLFILGSIAGFIIYRIINRKKFSK